MRHLALSALVVLLLAAALETVIYFRLPLQEIPLDKIQWTINPYLVALGPIKRDGNAGLLLLRVRDAKEQLLAGEWLTNFGSRGNVYTFGSLPGEQASTTKRIYDFEENDKILPLLVKKKEEKIVSVQENRRGTYLFIEMRSDKRTVFCLLERLAGQEQDCIDLTVGSATEGRWNPAVDQELALSDKKGNIWSVDPWAEKDRIRGIDRVNDAAHYRELAAIFENKLSPDAGVTTSPSAKKVWTFLNFALVRGPKDWSVYRIPLWAQAGWLSDGEHLLIKERSRLSILELKTRSLATLLTDPQIGQATAFFRADSDKKL